LNSETFLFNHCQKNIKDIDTFLGRKNTPPDPLKFNQNIKNNLTKELMALRLLIVSDYILNQKAAAEVKLAFWSMTRLRRLLKPSVDYTVKPLYKNIRFFHW